MEGERRIGVGGGVTEDVYSIQRSELDLKPSPPIESKISNVVTTRLDRKSTRLNSSHSQQSRMPSSA